VRLDRLGEGLLQYVNAPASFDGEGFEGRSAELRESP
jgi:hypothetical protein